MAIEPILKFLGVKYQKPFMILCDNKAACMLSDSDYSTRRMRHILTRLKYLQERVSDRDIMLTHIDTKGNLADIGTKIHTARVFHDLLSLIYTE